MRGPQHKDNDGHIALLFARRSYVYWILRFQLWYRVSMTSFSSSLAIAQARCLISSFVFVQTSRSVFLLIGLINLIGYSNGMIWGKKGVEGLEGGSHGRGVLFFVYVTVSPPTHTPARLLP